MWKRVVTVCAFVACVWWSCPVLGRYVGEVSIDAPALAEPVLVGTVEEEVDIEDEDALDCGDCEEDADVCCCDCPMRTIAKGEISGFKLDDPAFHGARMVIRSPEAWVRFWRRHTSNLEPPPPLPQVDFERRVVLAAVLGLRPTGGGPEIVITRAKRCEDVARVRVKVVNRPGPLDVITNPFHIVKVPIACVPRANSVAFVSYRPRLRPGAVAGQVRGAEEPGTPGEPLAGALVQLIRPSPESEPVAETETDDRGHYELADIRPGLYHLVAVAEGYARLGVPVAVRSGETAHRDLVLLPPLDEPPDDVRPGDGPPGGEPPHGSPSPLE